MARPQHSTPPRAHTDRTGLRSALWLPLFDGLADPALVARLAAEAEEAGWHGVFVWDQLDWRAPVREVADPWITLAAIATATQHLRLGPMVTPLARRRPAKVARETATLDRLSGGRLTLGVGLGADRFAGELSKTGEQLDDRLRGRMLDEALEILTAAWSGAPVHHRGEHYTVDGVTLKPAPAQDRLPIWIGGNRVPSQRRAARWDGWLPDSGYPPGAGASPEDVSRGLTLIGESRSTDEFDVAVVGESHKADRAAYEEAGATWWLESIHDQRGSPEEMLELVESAP